jgi:GAF domain-containing protein
VQPFYLLAYWLSRRGRVRLAAYVPVVILFLIMAGSSHQLGIGHVTLIGYAMVATTAGILIGTSTALFFVLLSVATHMVVGLAQAAGGLPGALPPEATVTADGIGLGLGLVVVVIFNWLSSREMSMMLHREQEWSAELRTQRATLEQRITERTANLERRSLHLEAAAQVARDAAAIRDVGQLLNATVRLISDHFGFYHAGIFLLDDAREYAVLRAASSEGGQQMLARGHRLKVGEVGIVGYATDTGEPRVALGVGVDGVFFDNLNLPDTRSEMGLPLKVREQVIGVLDVQSTEKEAFSDEDVAILQTMADQVALAIENARLLEESRHSLRELETLHGQQAREAWRERVASQPAAYRYTGVGVETVPPSAALETEAPRLHSRPVIVQEQERDGRRLIAPIRLRGQTLGSIALQQDPESAPWSDEEIALVEELSTQIGLALENARLLEETQQRAEQERIIANITARVRSSMDPKTILRTAVRELGAALGTDRAFVQLGAGGRRNEK